MLASRDPVTRTILLIYGGIIAVALLIGSIALLVWVKRSERAGPATPVAIADPKPTENSPKAGETAVSGTAVLKPAAAAGAKRFTLRLGQGFRFKDGVVVARKEDDPDVVFKYLPPQVGGLSTRYNPISQQVETGFEPTLNSPVPLLVSTKINVFEAKPNVAKTTTGDVAGYANQAPIGTKARYVLLMNRAGDPYLLTIDELEAPLGRYDDWRIGFAYEAVQLPVGLADGKINKPLPGKLIYRDWYHSKMIVRVDLRRGKEEAIADGMLPCTSADGLLAFGDSSGAYVIRDASGNVRDTIRFDEQVNGPALSPDGTRVLGSVYRAGPPTQIGGVSVRGSGVPSVGVFDLSGREVASVVGYDDASWTPDGKVIATAKYNDAGLFEIDPSTKAVRNISPAIGAAYSPSVSADGKTIVFITGGKAWLIDRDGKNLRQVFVDGHNQQRPAFSPDGTKVALIVCNLFAIDGSGEVYVIDVKTGDVTAVRTSTGVSLVPDTSTRLNWVE
jgi:hypothetical protein